MGYENKTGYPSVTDILSPFIDKRWFKPIHRKRGSAVHSAVSSNLKGLFVPSLPPAWQPYYDSWLPFRKHIVKILIIEKRLVDDQLKYCGQPDLVAQMDNTFNNATAVMDWKTSQTIYKSFPVQLGGYCKLVHGADIIPDIGISCRLRKEPGKKMLIKVYDYSDLVYYMDSFIAARRCYQDLIE